MTKSSHNPSEVEAFRTAVRQGEVEHVERLLAASPRLRSQINAPMFDFGQRAAHVAAKNAAMLEVLIATGADLNLRSEWENGPYTVLDNADEPTARFILARGATLTANVAARLGWLDDLQAIVSADPATARARGGDGQQPLHEAKTIAIADFLLEHGVDIDARCVDHKSTPAQYALVDRPDVCRRLLDRGATPDIFVPARLGDRALAARLLDADPTCVAARTNEGGYALVPPLNIYCWSLGFSVSPNDVALRFEHRDVFDLLVERSPADVRFLDALTRADEPAAEAVLRENPSLVGALSREAHGRLARAIFSERFAAAALMLRLGFDPEAPGVDGGSALHAACWVGSVPMVEALLRIGRVPIGARDPTHGSTPLGWAAFGSVHRRARGADYVGVVERLVAAGADVKARGNRSGQSLAEMAEGNAAVRQTLRRHGAG